MTFAHPWWLLGALVAGGSFAFALRSIARRRDARSLTYSNLAFVLQALRPNPLAERLFAACWITAVALFALSLAHPRASLWLPAKDGAVFICIDTSGSMRSSDVQPTRWDAAKAAARAFVNQTPDGTKIGVIAFSGDAAILAPPVSDKDRAAAAIDQLPPPNGGTAIGDALQLALSGLPKTGQRAVVLVTDGVSNRGSDPMAAAQTLAAQRVRLYTIGIGTNEGAVIPGTAQEATIDEDALRAYAQITGGAYARADNAGALRSALAQLGRTTTLERRPVDLALASALAGALVAVATFLTGLTLGRYA
jgi:Ca-activated chloride channel family protein